MNHFDDLSDIRVEAGVIKSSECKRLCHSLSLTVDELMITLLPIAAKYAKAGISGFSVGAIVKSDLDKDEFPNLYLGANIEFVGRSLSSSLHAEQSALSNAWLHGENAISKIATSAMPCGYCRQFLFETVRNNSLSVIAPSSNEKTTIPINNEIQQLLPNAFGPNELGNSFRLMEKEAEWQVVLASNDSTNDPTLLLACESAASSYAPYTKNIAGCVIELNNGKLFSGRSAENVAHNPSLLAFSAALSQLVLGSSNDICLDDLASNIRRVVLAEYAGLSSQKDITTSLLSSCNKSVCLEYYSLPSPVPLL